MPTGPYQASMARLASTLASAWADTDLSREKEPVGSSGADRSDKPIKEGIGSYRADVSVLWFYPYDPFSFHLLLSFSTSFLIFTTAVSSPAPPHTAPTVPPAWPCARAWVGQPRAPSGCAAATALGTTCATSS
jgi:hypothetical protein